MVLTALLFWATFSGTFILYAASEDRGNISDIAENRFAYSLLQYSYCFHTELKASLLTAHCKMFEFPDLRDLALEHSSLHVQVSLGLIHVTLWELAVSELI